ncbi:MAG: hypothetical protein ABW022_12385 [Actinoplanes sp.]
MQDWNAEQEQHRARTARPYGKVSLGSVLALVVLLLLVALACGVVLRGMAGPSWTAPAPGAASSEEAVVQAEILFGSGLSAANPDATNLSPGQTAVLRNANTEVEVTPGRVSVAATGTCASGPLLTVELTVERMRGTAVVSVADFFLRADDGSALPAAAPCSTGFLDAAPKRSLVFAAAEAGRLLYGPDPAAPIAVWRLS